MLILGISAYYHDAAACLLRDGVIVAACQEESFSRRVHDARFPEQAIAYCLQAAGCLPDAIDHVVFYDKPFLKFERLLETWLAFAPRGFNQFRRAMPAWTQDKLFQKFTLLRELRRVLGEEVDWKSRLLYSEHHLSHAASAFFASPFEEAAILTLDGVGEWTTTSIATGCGHRLEILSEIRFPHSLGLLYSAFTQYLGFEVNSGEYKMMGLAPYGQPLYADLIRRNLIDLRDDGSFRLDMRHFGYGTGDTMTTPRFHALFGGPPRTAKEPVMKRHADLAASIQSVTEEAILTLARHIRHSTGQTRLCLAGGVALNCVANGRLAREGIFEDIWIQPAAGDAGGALGAALAAHHLALELPRPTPSGDLMQGSLLGPDFSTEQIRHELDALGATYTWVEDDTLLVDSTARAIAEGRIVGWHQGRMEFGPRALGNRSILADPRSPDAWERANSSIKFREAFRPFAPSILREHAAEWYELPGESPYMLLAVPLLPGRRLAAQSDADAVPFSVEAKLREIRSAIPAVTHVDYSARVQTVEQTHNPRFHALLQSFAAMTGCPILLNTSFNVRNEPMVLTPGDAYRCFMATGLDLLVIGNAWLDKNNQTLPPLSVARP